MTLVKQWRTEEDKVKNNVCIEILKKILPSKWKKIKAFLGECKQKKKFCTTKALMSVLILICQQKRVLKTSLKEQKRTFVKPADYDVF